MADHWDEMMKGWQGSYDKPIFSVILYQDGIRQLKYITSFLVVKIVYNHRNIQTKNNSNTSIVPGLHE